VRVSGSRLGRIRDDERGAVLMIVALCLLILLGMLVLTVDLGRGVAYKRQLVNGADAAALAAAQQCALGNGSSAARAAGLDVVNRNVDLSGASATFLMPECDNPVDFTENSVTVVATADIDYYFAPIFGISSGDVAARAVAVWGAVGEANPIPITVDEQQLWNNCGIVQGSPPKDERECDLTYPKDALQEPRWGVLDLAQWGDPDAAPCQLDANTLKDIIESGGWGDPLPENNFDCLDNGLSFSVWATMEGRVLTFPVMDILRSTGTVKPGGGDVPCTGADIPALRAAGKDCQIDTAYVIGFISLLVNDVINNGSTVEVDTTFLGSTTGNGIPCAPGQDCADFGLRAVRLVE